MTDFNIKISAIDEVSNRVDKINAAIEGVGKTAQKTTAAARQRAQKLDLGDLLFSAKRLPNAISGLQRWNKELRSGQPAIGVVSAAFKEIGITAKVAGIVSREALERTRERLDDVRDAASAVRDKLGAFSPALGGLAAATTFAGLGELVNHFAEFGNRTTQTAAQLGISRREVQVWGRTFEKAGFSASDGLGAIDAANKAVLNAKTGDPTALGIADILKLDTSGSPQKYVLSLADAIKKLHDSGQGVATLGNVLSSLGFDPKLLPLYEQGSQALLNMLDAQRQLSLISDDAIERGAALNKSLVGLRQSAGDLANEIGDAFAPQIDRAAQKLDHWLQDLKDSPDELKAVTAGVEVLATAMGVTAVAGVARLVAALNGWWALPAMRFLISPAGAVVLGAMGGYAAHEVGPDAANTATGGNYDAAGLTPYGMPSVADTKKALGAPGLPPSKSGPSLWDRIIDGLGVRSHDASATPGPGGGAPSPSNTPGPQGAIQPPPASKSLADRIAGAIISPAEASPMVVPGRADVASQFAQSGLPLEAQAFMRDISSGEARGFDQLAGRGVGTSEAYGDRPGYAGFPNWEGFVHDYQGRSVTSHGAGLFQDEPATWQQIAAGTQLTNFRDPQQQIQGNWWWAQKVYQDATGKDLLADLKGGALDPRGRSALGGQWARGSVAGGDRYQSFLAGMPPAEAGGGGKWLPKGYGVGAIDAALQHMGGGRIVETSWENPSELTARRAALATEAAPLPSPLASQDQEGGNTNHEVTVNFANAPAGMKSGLTRADGPGAITVRTSYAMTEQW